MEESVEQHLDTLNSYTEVSPSGKGIHVIVKGRLPPGRWKKGPVEMYSEGRFFTMSGTRLSGMPATIENRAAELKALHAQVFGVQETPLSGNDRGEPLPSRSDDEIIGLASQAENRDKFLRLMGGDTSGYDSASEADGALCCLLVFWTRDPEQTERIFRQSGLFRSKWDEKRGEGTYGKNTIKSALKKVTAEYRGRRVLKLRSTTETQEGKAPLYTAVGRRKQKKKKSGWRNSEASMEQPKGKLLSGLKFLKRSNFPSPKQPIRPGFPERTS